MRTMLTMVNVVQIIISDVALPLYITSTSFWTFPKLQFIFHILAFTKFLLRWCATMLTIVNVVQMMISDMAHTVYITFKAFWNFSKLLFVFHNFAFTKFLESFRHCAHFVYHICSVLKLFKMAVCFAQFGFYEISTPVMRTMLTMVNVVQIILSNIAHTVYITFTVFWNFSKLLFVFAHFGCYEISTPMMRTMQSIANIV